MPDNWSGVVDATVLRLYAATAAAAVAIATFTIAVPFYVLEKLGRTDAVGYLTASGTASYLLTCLLLQRFSGKFNPRWTTSGAAACVGLIMGLFSITSRFSQMLPCMIAQGLAMGLFWPLLMGWLSGDAEGVRLSRRLALFNLSWSTSLAVGPQVGGLLAQVDVALAVRLVSVGWLAAAIVTALTPLIVSKDEPQPGGAPAEPAEAIGASPEATEAQLDRSKARYIRYVAWAGVFVGHTAYGVFRFQTPHLAETVGISKAMFGSVMMCMSIATAACFVIAARWSGWHGKMRWIFGPQLVLVAGAFAATWADSALKLIPLVSLVGFIGGLLYMTSIFYGSVGAEPAIRPRRMAIHEICLSAGIGFGSLFGNMLSQSLGPSRVYPYLAGMLLAVTALQWAAWEVLRRRG